MATNRGQTKTHLVQDAQGNQFEMSQEDWRNRDKAAGLVRVDETTPDESLVTDEVTVPEEGTPTPAE